MKNSSEIRSRGPVGLDVYEVNPKTRDRAAEIVDISPKTLSGVIRIEKVAPEQLEGIEDCCALQLAQENDRLCVHGSEL